MFRKSLGVFAAAGLLAVAVAGPVSAQAPEDPLGVVEIPAGEPVVIAGWGVLSGADASLGQDWVNSMIIAANDRDNEIMGHPIEIITEDAGCTPEGGATAAAKLASNPQLVGLIGSACSDETVGRHRGHHERRPDHHLAVQHAPGPHRPRDPRPRVRGLPAHGPQRRLPGQGRGRVRLQRAGPHEGRHDP